MTFAVAAASAVMAGDPPLPVGLTSGSAGESTFSSAPPSVSDEPALPEGLGGVVDPLPEGASPADESTPNLGLARFWDTRAGIRAQDDEAVDEDFTLGETRLRLEYLYYGEGVDLSLKGDLLIDGLATETSIDFEAHEGPIQLREASFGMHPNASIDLRIGRQALTWGTGDLVFVNDLFPKDFNSFFIGRDGEYLKSPADALKTSVYLGLVNIDLVYSPRFDSNRYLDPDRLSFFGSQSVGEWQVDKPDEWFSDDEWALRLYKRAGSWELAFYGYDGFWKGPEGVDFDRQALLFPELAVYGASVRGPVGGGIFNLEYGYYDSKNAGMQEDVYSPPSEQRVLLGYQRELTRDMTLGLQYYLVHIEQYDEYQETRPASLPYRDRDRHVVTMRLTKLLLNHDLRLSLFVFMSSSDQDAYLRPQLHYKLDDHSSVEVGANLFTGEERDTFFGQLEDNTNVYAGFRYNF